MGSTQQRQEIPTHLEVEDRILFGLTLRQGIFALVGCSIGYTVFAQLGHLPWPVAAGGSHMPLALRIAVACVPALVALAAALIQPAGRPFEEWLFALARFATLPKHCVWRPRIAAPESLKGLDDEEASEQGTSLRAAPDA